MAVACSGNGENGGKNPGRQMWVHEKPLVAKVEVGSGGSVIETYEYTYDEQGRMLTLVKTDKLSKEIVLDLQYTYPAENQMRIKGKFFPIASQRYIDVSYDPASGTMSYSGSWKDAWSYSTTVNDAGVVTSTKCKSYFASKEGYYTSNMDFGEVYTVSGGSITESVAGTDISAQSSKSTSAENTSSLKTAYTFCDQDDRQNFAAYLMPGNFPVWIASGFPGNKKLVTGISASTGTIPAPETTAIEYSFNAAGDIDTAVRTDSNAGTPYLTRTYKFIYQ